MLEKDIIDVMEEEMRELRRESMRAKKRHFGEYLEQEDEEEASMALI